MPMSHRRVSNFLSNRLGQRWLAGGLATLVTTAIDRRPTLVRWDGQDWEYVWPGGAIYASWPTYSPRALIERNWPLFVYDYTPKVGDVVIDVGAGFGTETEAYSQLVGHRGYVIAIEPDPDQARRLRKLVARRGLSNVRVLCLALSDTEGSATLSKTSPDGVTNSIVSLPEGAASLTIPVTTLSNVLRNHTPNGQADYLKLNVEGAEIQILRGSRQDLDKIRHWCISCHDFLDDPRLATFADVTSLLRDVGMRARSHPGVADSPWAAFYVYARHPVGVV